MKALLASLLLAFPLTLLAAEPHPHHHGAHVHGLAKLEAALDGGQLTLRLESPLEALLGFEHAPRSAAEQKAVAEMKARLQAADRLFVLTGEAGCTLKSATHASQALEGKSKAEHGDLDAEFIFVCARPDKLRGLEARLFDVFPKLRRLDASVVTAKGQKAMKLSGKMRYLVW